MMARQVSTSDTNTEAVSQFHEPDAKSCGVVWCGPFSAVVLARQVGDCTRTLKHAAASCRRLMVKAVQLACGCASLPLLR